MKIGWQAKTIGEVCEVVNGGTPKTGIKEFWNGVHLWITPAEMGKRASPYVSETERQITDKGLGNSSAKLLPQKSVILSSRAPIGHLVINTEPMAFNQGCKGLIPSDNLQYKYLYYYLVGKVDLLNSLGTGATFKELSGGKLKEVPIPLPPLPEQQRIVSILDEAFVGIATATANAEKNLANARELFESYLQSVFDNKGVDWVEKRLGEVSDLLDCLHKTPKYVDSGFPMVRVTDVKKGYLNLSRTKQVDKTTFDAFSKKYTPKIGDIVFSRVGSYGVSSLVNSNDPFCLGQNTVFIIPKIHPTFLYYFLNSSIAKLQYDELVEGVTQPTISMKSIRAVSLFVPPSMEEQTTLAQKIDELSTETKRLEAIYLQKLNALEELKKSILNQAFSGQLQ
jgi:type I restriction enzyme S subunit